MTGYIYKLNIAGTVMEFDVPLQLSIGESCRPFVMDSNESDIIVSFSIGKPDMQQEVKLKDRSPIVWKGKDYYRVERNTLSRHPQGCVYLRDDLHYVEGYLYSDERIKIKSLEDLLEISEMEILLATLGTISLHSSIVMYQDKAILFSGPSGVGKSTQAELWARYRGAILLNGDRSLIRKIDGKWTAFGSPFAGTSGIYCNEKAVIKTIAVLRQAEDCSVIQISPMEAFRYLYSETVIPRWNDKTHIRILDLLASITEEVPVCMLNATPDENAVDVLERYLRK